jgi:hypothetical protein
MTEDDDETEDEEEEEKEAKVAEGAEEEIPFECDEENKVEVHDALANMLVFDELFSDNHKLCSFISFEVSLEPNESFIPKRILINFQNRIPCRNPQYKKFPNRIEITSPTE